MEFAPFFDLLFANQIKNPMTAKPTILPMDIPTIAPVDICDPLACLEVAAPTLGFVWPGGLRRSPTGVMSGGGPSRIGSLEVSVGNSFVVVCCSSLPREVKRRFWEEVSRVVGSAGATTPIPDELGPAISGLTDDGVESLPELLGVVEPRELEAAASSGVEIRLLGLR